MNIKIDSLKIKEAADDVVRLTGEINEIIETIYETIANIQKVDGGWTGNAAEVFIRNAMIEKGNIIAFKNAILEFGQFLSAYAAEYGSKVEEVKQNA